MCFEVGGQIKTDLYSSVKFCYDKGMEAELLKRRPRAEVGREPERRSLLACRTKPSSGWTGTLRSVAAFVSRDGDSVTCTASFTPASEARRGPLFETLIRLA